VAPAVDLTVLGLLLAIRELAHQGASINQIRPARRLLVFASLVTLALNVAEPAIAGDAEKAVFDAVGPLLLIGWAETGPSLLHAMAATRKSPEDPEKMMDTCDVVPAPSPGPSSAAANPTCGQRQVKHRLGGAQTFEEPGDKADWSSRTTSGRVESVAAAEAARHETARPTAGVAAVARARPAHAGRKGQAQPSVELLARARAEDKGHWRTYRRPISAETLRKRLHVGASTARALVAILRTEPIHAVLPVQAGSRALRESTGDGRPDDSTDGHKRTTAAHDPVAAA